MSDEVKPGIRSTEFYIAMVVTVCMCAAVLLQLYRGQIDLAGAAAALAAGVASLGYSISRGNAKAGGAE